MCFDFKNKFPRIYRYIFSSPELQSAQTQKIGLAKNSIFTCLALGLLSEIIRNSIFIHSLYFPEGFN